MKEVRSTWSRERGEAHPRLESLPVRGRRRATLAPIGARSATYRQVRAQPCRQDGTRSRLSAAKAQRRLSRRSTGA